MVLGAGLAMGVTLVHAQVLDRSIETENRITRQAAEAQHQINQLDEETQQLVEEYRRVISETVSLRTYNRQMQAIANKHLSKIESTNDQLPEDMAELPAAHCAL